MVRREQEEKAVDRDRNGEKEEKDVRL